MQEQSRARFPALGAVLSFLFPGLGQLYAGQPTIAAVLATPVLLIGVVGLGAYLLLSDRLRSALFSSQFLTTLLALDLALLMWRLFAIAHVGLARPFGPDVSPAGETPVRTTLSSASGPGAAALAPIGPEPTTALSYHHRRAWEIAMVVLLVILTVVMHAWAGIVISRLDRTLHDVFAGGTPIVSGGSNQPLNQPNYHWDGRQRINFLLLGIDSGPYRSEALTDTILVVSIDPVRRDADMVSIPRDTGFMPLPDRRIYADGRFPDKINSLTTVASQNPKLWCPDLPSGADCGIRTLQRSVGLYLGIDINYYATVNLQGFADLIDALGGVEVCLDGTLTDPTYKNPTPAARPGLYLGAGCHRLNGLQALAYARIRKGTMTLPNGTVVQQNDFTRSAHQQEVLLSLQKGFARSNWVFALPDILKAIGETVTTDFPRDDAGNLASLSEIIDPEHIQRVVLGWPGYVDLPTQPLVNYLLIPKRAAVRAEAKELFGADGPLKGWYVGSTSNLPPATAP
jgi:LCP family protein required for cell wall assembly